MANLLSTDDITVLGGPAVISVDLDFGPTGQRGSKFFIKDGNPNSITFDDDILFGDLCINSDSESVEYRSIYMYQSVPGGSTWTKITNLIPNFYSRKTINEFADGTITVEIPLISITPDTLVGEMTTDRFVIQHSIVNTVNPTVSNLSITSITEVDSLQVLRLSVNAVEFDNGEWTSVNGQRSLHLFISVV